MKKIFEYLLLFIACFGGSFGAKIITDKYLTLGAYTPLSVYDARFYKQTDSISTTSLQYATPALLASVSNVDLKTIATTTIFTSSGNCVATMVVVGITSADTITADPVIVIGSNIAGATLYNNFATLSVIFPKTPPAPANGALNKVIPLVYNSASAGELLSAGSKLVFNVTTGATATTLLATVQTFGFCY